MVEGIRFYLLPALLLPGCGLFAGPITDAAEAAFDVPIIDDARFGDERVEPLTSSHGLSAGSRTTTLPADADTAIWGPVIRSHLAALAAGQPGVFRIDVEGLRIEASAPVVIGVELSSRDETVWGLASDAPVQLPATCVFDVDPGTTSAELARRLTICAEDWVIRNGVPNELEMTITAGFDELPAGKQGLTSDFVAEWTQQLRTERELEADCKVVTMDPDLVKNGEHLDLESAVISGWGYSSAQVYLGAFAIVHDATGRPRSLALLSKAIAPGTRYWIVAAAEEYPSSLESYLLAGNVQPVLSPGMPRFPSATVEALAAGGQALACWSVFGEAPRTGGIGITIAGSAKLKGFRTEDAD